MRDLEFEWGRKSSGCRTAWHMEAVGYDLYCKMLNEAVKQLKGGTEEEIYTTVMDLNVDAYIPNSYIPNEISEAGYLQADRGN